MRFKTSYTIYLSTATITLGNADGFTNHAVNHHFRIRNKVPVSSFSSPSSSSPSTCLNAFGFRTLKRILLDPSTPTLDPPTFYKVEEKKEESKDEDLNHHLLLTQEEQDIIPKERFTFGFRTLKRLLFDDPSTTTTPILKESEEEDLNQDLTEEQVRGLFTLWNEALLTGDSRIVAQRYTSDPLLLPTVSDIPRTDYEGVKDYFDHFLQLQPCGEILEGKIQCGPGWAQDAGIYEFTLGAKNGSKLKARYSYLYVFDKQDGQWKISHHHSSAMPEESTKAKIITKEEVQNLFNKWSEALDTGDPDAVASLYAKDAVLLPTVSDIPRTDYAGIQDYFVHFLKLEPKGEIVESHVTCGEHWCEDVGIYEFTLGTTGEKVRARYSFVYTQQEEDGEWKITHHHSSKMPEAVQTSGATSSPPHRLTEDQVRALFDTWNDALLSLDPDQVTKLYSTKNNNAVLLPTVSDRPRYTYESIRDYFVNFLFKYPEGEILESHVTCGDDWCKNVGIYQFRMGLTGEVIMARYTFVYVWDQEENDWKISHHHSSVMPEAMIDAEKRLKQLEENKKILRVGFNHSTHHP